MYCSLELSHQSCPWLMTPCPVLQLLIPPLFLAIFIARHVVLLQGVILAWYHLGNLQCSILHSLQWFVNLADGCHIWSFCVENDVKCNQSVRSYIAVSEANISVMPFSLRYLAAVVDPSLILLRLVAVQHFPTNHYRKTSNIRRRLVGNKIVDHSDVQ